MKDQTEADVRADYKAAWDAAYLIGLENAARCVEQLGGEFAFRINPIEAAAAIRALKDK